MSADDVRDRVVALERDLRVGLHQATREVSTERIITRDLVEALHVRFDNFEQTVMGELRTIKTMISTRANSNGADLD